MRYTFADRMANTPRSFIREILKVTQSPEIISFAGGLPNPTLFPVKELAATAKSVILNDSSSLQYSTTEGYLPLREWICKRYHDHHHLTVKPEEILITNGSQQCLDLIGKTFINKGTLVGIERPGYLGAIQAFSMFEPTFTTVSLNDEGPDLTEFSEMASKKKPAFFYGVPNSQNPSGITWSEKRREALAKIAKENELIMIEDDAYGELKYQGQILPKMRSYLHDQVVMTGSFSKIVSPGMRMGWLCGPEEIIEQAVTLKQGTDLHSNYLSQRIICEYLQNYSLDDYITKITDTYRTQCNSMIEAIKEHFPESVKFTVPNGGMFIWATLPKGYSSMEIFERALKENVAVLPGVPFYLNGDPEGERTMRLNYSNADPEKIKTGISRLGKILKEYLKE